MELTRCGHDRPGRRRGHDVARRPGDAAPALAPLLARGVALLSRRLERLAREPEFGIRLGPERLELLALAFATFVHRRLLLHEPPRQDRRAARLGRRPAAPPPAFVAVRSSRSTRSEGSDDGPRLRGSEEFALQRLARLPHRGPGVLEPPRLELEPFLGGRRRGLSRGGDDLKPLRLGAEARELGSLVGDPSRPLPLAIRLRRGGFGRRGRRGAAHLLPALRRGLGGGGGGLERREALLAGDDGLEPVRDVRLALLHRPPPLLHRRSLRSKSLRLGHVPLTPALQLGERLARVRLGLLASRAGDARLLRRGSQLRLRAPPIRRRLGEFFLEFPFPSENPGPLRRQLGPFRLEPRGGLLEGDRLGLGVLLGLRDALRVGEHRRGLTPVGGGSLRESLGVVPGVFSRSLVTLDRREPQLQLRVQRRVLLHPYRRVQLPSLRGGELRGEFLGPRRGTLLVDGDLFLPPGAVGFPRAEFVEDALNLSLLVREGVLAFLQPRGGYPGGVGVYDSLGEPSVRVRNLGVRIRSRLLRLSLRLSRALQPRYGLLALLHGAGAVSLEGDARRGECRAFALDVSHDLVARRLGLPRHPNLLELICVHPLDISRRGGAALVAFAVARLQRATRVLEAALSLRRSALDVSHLAHAFGELGAALGDFLLDVAQL